MRPIAELSQMITEWALTRNLLPGDPKKQYLKFLEETGETARALLKGDECKVKDGFGDMTVTVIILAGQLDISLNAHLANKGVIADGFEDIMELVSGYYISEDIIYHLSRLAHLHGQDLTECLNIAWKEIKDRTGKTVDGTFIKDE